MGFFSPDGSSSRRRAKHPVAPRRLSAYSTGASASHRGRSSHNDARDRSSSRERSRSRGPAASIAGSLFNIAGGSRASFFGLPGNNASKSSFFGASRPSYYKRSSRPGFMVRAYRHLKRILRDIVHWAKRHPIKVLMLVLVPLITSGALVALLARFGLRIPATIERWIRTGARAASGDTFGAVGEAMRMASGRGGISSAAAVSSVSSMASTTRSVVGGPAGGKSSGESIWSSALKFFTD